MSGHSHAKTILHKKTITDQKRGKIFSKLARLISIASKEKGGDPKTNSGLKMAIDRAKKVNMPKDKIEQAIKRGTGETKEAQLENALYEAYGPGKIAIIIECITDNKNRTLAEVKQILNQNSGKFADSGSVKWLFEKRGCITVNNEQKTMNNEDLELMAIEVGAEDILWNDNLLDIYTKPEELEKVRKNLEEEKVEIESSSLDWTAKETIEIEEKDKEKAEKLFESLDENEAIQDIYSNLNN